MKQILLYEDNDSLRNTLVAIFSVSKEYKIVGAYFNPSNILEDLLPHHIDAILMDIDVYKRQH